VGFPVANGLDHRGKIVALRQCSSQPSEFAFHLTKLGLRGRAIRRRCQPRHSPVNSGRKHSGIEELIPKPDQHRTLRDTKNGLPWHICLVGY
jgi:hypothetical protein